MRLMRLVIALGLATLVAAMLAIWTRSPLFEWLTAGFGFAFVVSGLIYRAENRPEQRHRVK